jgi:phage gp46-like protein
MADIALLMTESSFGDFSIVNDDLLRDNDLETAVLVSLFCDARATPDQLPDGVSTLDLRGFWGDVVIENEGDQTGSLLWLLHREKQTANVLVRAKQYAENALKWMLDDLAAKSVVVETSHIATSWMLIHVTITRPDGSRVDYKYDYEWQQQAIRARAA